MEKNRKKEQRKPHILIISIIIILITLTISVINIIKVSDYKYETSSFHNIQNSEKYENKILDNYDEYKKLLDKLNIKLQLTKKDFQKHKYLALFLLKDSCGEEIEKVTIEEKDLKNIKVVVKVNATCESCIDDNALYLIPVKKLTDKNAKITIKNKIKMIGECNLFTVDKPIIYLYPETKQEIEVKLGKPENLIRTYPNYTSSWKVLAEPSGKLTDLETKRELYSLYWEGKMRNNEDYQDGFIVKKEDLISFFEEKLTILGLSYREQEEFIIYWLPQLDNNDYTYVRFMSEEEINKVMPLQVTPSPDNTIRVWMQYKQVDSKYKTQEQELKSPSRTGYVLVEWGGTELK